MDLVHKITCVDQFQEICHLCICYLFTKFWKFFRFQYVKITCGIIEQEYDRYPSLLPRLAPARRPVNSGASRRWPRPPRSSLPAPTTPSLPSTQFHPGVSRPCAPWRASGGQFRIRRGRCSAVAARPLPVSAMSAEHGGLCLRRPGCPLPCQLRGSQCRAFFLAPDGLPTRRAINGGYGA
jgi:hypothetical protein